MSDPPPAESADLRKLAKRLLAARTPVDQVERTLTEAGLEPTAASELVNDMLAARAARLAGARETAPAAPSWARIALGLGLAAAGFAWAYHTLKARDFDIMAGPVIPLLV